MAFPLTLALPISAAALTAANCWRIKPGFFLPDRIFSMEKGFPAINDRDREVLRICPPPSPCDRQWQSYLYFFLFMFRKVTLSAVMISWTATSITRLRRSAWVLPFLATKVLADRADTQS
jgi:hypothetical protein